MQKQTKEYLTLSAKGNKMRYSKQGFSGLSELFHQVEDFQAAVIAKQ